MGIYKIVRRFGQVVMLLFAPASMGLGLLAYTAPAASASTVSASTVSALTVSAASASAASAALSSAGTGWLRLAHLSPNTPPVDVYLYSFHSPNALVVLHHVAYGTISGYETVPSGQYTVAMRGAGAPPSAPPVLSTTVDVHPGGAYTVAGMGPANGLQLQIFKDRLTTPRGKALVRIIQASLVQHRVTVAAGHKVLVRNLKFATVTSYVAVPAGTWKVKAAGVSEHTSASIDLVAGTIHTIVVLDDPGRLMLDDLVDAAGSRVIPAVPPATGLGGTAPRPAPSSLPWLLLVAGGLLLCAVGARWVIRPHGIRRSGIAGLQR